MYVRFQVRKQDPDSRSWQGLFSAAYELRELDLEAHEREVLEQALAWFRMHLKIPPCLSRPQNQRAICWFKPSARKPMAYARDLVWLLKERGVHVEQISAASVGMIIYEDGWQVVAKPSRRKKSQRKGTP